jgi:kinesin family member 18/19
MNFGKESLFVCFLAFGKFEQPLRNNRNREKQYVFDFAFDKHASQDDVFSKLGVFLVDGCLKGYNATIFAYGATGAGKTHTMSGSQDAPGIMPQMVNYLYKTYESTLASSADSIKVSYIEVYNEVIRDLLTSEDTPIDIREDPVRGISIAGVTEVTAESYGEVMAMLRVGNKNRTKEPTEANEVSSRSHAVFQISVEVTPNNGGEVLSSKLSLIDLAGSERAAFTGNKGIRMIEGANINKSLLALGNCINALSESADKRGNNFIPYRDSKLTRLLKDSLGGNCRTVMIANISPAVICYEDTLNTLKYANRAKQIKMTVTKNTHDAAAHISNYATIISSLKKENEELKKKALVSKKSNSIQKISTFCDIYPK